MAPILKILGIKVVYSERNDASVIRNDLGYRFRLYFSANAIKYLNCVSAPPHIYSGISNREKRSIYMVVAITEDNFIIY